jgi:hypothetical protein
MQWIHEAVVASSKIRALWYNSFVDRESEARAIVAAAAKDRKRPSRGMWIAAILAAVVCTSVLVIAWIREADTVPDKPLPRQAVTQSSGLGLGTLLGVGAGIAIGSAFAIRRRNRS